MNFIVEELIDRCGGQSTVARKLRIERATVWQWTRRGRIPYKRWCSIQRVWPEIAQDYEVDHVCNI
jgi:DNA invertase Pin-like site-specific DNA recombinase